MITCLINTYKKKNENIDPAQSNKNTIFSILYLISVIIPRMISLLNLFGVESNENECFNSIET